MTEAVPLALQSQRILPDDGDAGPEGFVLEGFSCMEAISREAQDIVTQVTAAHQYPDGFMLFLGTLVAPWTFGLRAFMTNLAQRGLLARAL